MTQKTIYLNSFTCLVVCALSYFEGEFFPIYIYIYIYMNPDLEMPLGQVSIFIYLFILVSIGYSFIYWDNYSKLI